MEVASGKNTSECTSLAPDRTLSVLLGVKEAYSVPPYPKVQKQWMGTNAEK